MVTEKITEVVPVEEIVEDYEETLEDLRGFCRHLSDEVGTQFNQDLEELHQKLWQLDTSAEMSDNFSLSSLESARYARRGTVEEVRLNLSLVDHEPEEGVRERKLEKRSTIQDFLLNERLEKFASPPPHRPSLPLILGPDITVSTVSPLSSHSSSPVPQVWSAFPSPFTALSLSAIERPFSPFYCSVMSERPVSPCNFHSAVPSRRSSLTGDIISRYLSSKEMSSDSDYKEIPRRASRAFSVTSDTLSSSNSESSARRAATARHSALSVLVDYVKYKLGTEELLLSPAQILTPRNATESFFEGGEDPLGSILSGSSSEDEGGILQGDSSG